jgi:hypothetical protein
MLPKAKPVCPECSRPDTELVTSRPLYGTQNLVDIAANYPISMEYVFKCKCGRVFPYEEMLEEEDPPVISPNSFWLCLHELACAMLAEGESSAERQANILNGYKQMPKISKQQVQEELWELISFLPEINLAIRAASRGNEESKQQRAG